MPNALRIREIRQTKGLKAFELAAAAGISAPMLSQVEREVVDPSLETLRQIARVLEVPLFDLFAQDADPSQVHVVRKGEEVTLTSPGGGISYARKSKGGKGIEVLTATMAAHSVSRDTLWGHEAEECVLVIRGSLSVETDRGTHQLAAGDSCHFDSRIPHRFTNPTENEVEFIISVTPPSH